MILKQFYTNISKNRFLLSRSLKNFNDSKKASLHIESRLKSTPAYIFNKHTSFENHKQFTRCISSEPIREFTIPTFQYVGIPKIISDSTPVQFAQNGLIWLHEFTGLPWWATIACTAILLRTLITLPLTIHQITVGVRLYKLKPEFEDVHKQALLDTYHTHQTSNFSRAQAKAMYHRNVKREWNKLIIRDNCHPMKQYLLFGIQLPMWLSVTFAIRNLVYMLPQVNQASIITMLELKLGGCGWIQDLTAPDHLWILPIIYGLSSLTIIQIQSVLRVQESTRLMKVVLNILRGVSILMIPIAAYVPSSLAIYWVTSTFYGVLQNLLLASPKVRRIVRIPEHHGEIPNPYARLYDSITTPFGIRPKKPQINEPFIKL